MFKLTTIISLSVALVSGCASPYRQLISPATEPRAGHVLIRDVSVFTATDTKLLPHHDVLISEGRIQALHPTGQPPPPRAHIIEGAGKTLLPGFIDTHVHATFSGSTPYEVISPDPRHNLQAFLYAGVTTIYDLGGRASELAELKAQVQSGELIGPRIFHTHIPITVPGSHPLPATETVIPWPLNKVVAWLIPQIESLEQVDEVIDDYVARGVDYVKLTADQLPPGTPEMGDPILKASIEAVKRRGLKAVVHIGGVDKALVSAQAGATALVHHTWRTPISEAEAQQLAQTGVFYMATLAAWETTVEIGAGRHVPSRLAEEISPPILVESIRGARGSALLELPSVGEMVRFATQMRPTWAPSIKRLYEAGVPFLIGTDAGVPGIYPGSSLHDELRYLSEAGIPNAELLIAATRRGAEWLNPEADFGTIEVGKVADLVLLDGDPLVDITHSSKIHLVFRDGRALKRLTQGYPTAR